MKKIKNSFVTYLDICIAFMVNKVAWVGSSLALSCVITNVWMGFLNIQGGFSVIWWFASAFAGTFAFAPLVGFCWGKYYLFRIKNEYGKNVANKVFQLMSDTDFEGEINLDILSKQQ